jgi:outer membrane immunogenic protein
MNLNNFKCSVSAAAVALALGLPAPSPAVAADMPVKARPAPVAPVVSWAGFYLGGHVGLGRARTSGKYGPLGTDSTVLGESLRLRGFAGGVHGGYNWDAGNWVWGVEGDWSFTNWKRTAVAPGSSEALSGQVKSLASIRARLGIAVGPQRSVLLYATGGAGFVNAKATAINPSGPDQQALKFNDVGGVVGAGFEYAATNNIRLRAESLYYIFDKNSDVITISPAQPGDRIKLNDIWTARVGVSWYFNQGR